LTAEEAFSQSTVPLRSPTARFTRKPRTSHTSDHVAAALSGGFSDGADLLTKSTFEIAEAVVPSRLNDDWALITRTKLSAEVLPPKKVGDAWSDGLGNGYTTFFLSPEQGRDLYWGVGPVMYFPASSSMLAQPNGAPVPQL
jgi:hypothetical protein